MSVIFPCNLRKERSQAHRPSIGSDAHSGKVVKGVYFVSVHPKHPSFSLCSKLILFIFPCNLRKERSQAHRPSIGSDAHSGKVVKGVYFVSVHPKHPSFSLCPKLISFIFPCNLRKERSQAHRPSIGSDAHSGKVVKGVHFVSVQPQKP
jgi:hypothetical protein